MGAWTKNRHRDEWVHFSGDWKIERDRDGGDRFHVFRLVLGPFPHWSCNTAPHPSLSAAKVAVLDKRAARAS